MVGRAEVGALAYFEVCNCKLHLGLAVGVPEPSQLLSLSPSMLVLQLASEWMLA